MFDNSCTCANILTFVCDNISSDRISDKPHFIISTWIIIKTVFLNHLIDCFLVVIIGLTGCFAQTTPNICTKHQNLDRIQDVSDCTKYFECVDMQPVERKCEIGKQFDHQLRICTTEPVDCFQCPSEPFYVDLPVDHECAQFIRCIYGKPTHLICESELLFDPIRQQCNKKNQVICNCPSIDIPGIPYFVRDWNDCAK